MTMVDIEMLDIQIKNDRTQVVYFLQTLKQLNFNASNSKLN